MNVATVHQHFPPPSGFPEKTLTAYLRTQYRVELPGGSAILKIAQPNAALLAAMHEWEFAEAFLMTAHNPYSRPTAAAENVRRQNALLATLQARAARCWYGTTQAPDAWPTEPLVMVAGVEIGIGIDLARQFEQNAIVAVGPTAVSQLAFAV